MLAPVAAAYLFEQRAWPRARRVSGAANAEWRTCRAQRWRAISPGWPIRHARLRRRRKPANLISLKPGLNVGQWRDSQDGLAGGRYPFDVNAVFVPAAMTAIAKFVRSGVLTPYLTPEQHRALANAGRCADVWSREAPALFRVRISDADARRQITAYAADLGVSPTPALDCASWRRSRRECNRTRCAVQADSGPALRWWIRIAAAGSACGRTGATRRQHAAAVSRGPADRRRSAGGESGVCRCHSTASVGPDGLPRHGHLVLAASASGGRSRAPGCAARFAGSNRRSACAQRVNNCGR